MIQRIQTVFLAMAAVFNLSVVFTPIYDRTVEDPKIWISVVFIAGLFISALLSLFSIGQYKDRNRQVKWVKRAVLFQIVGTAVGLGILFSMGGIGFYLWDEALGCALVIAGLIVQLLALRAIKKDELLVRSIDRIR